MALYRCNIHTGWGGLPPLVYRKPISDAAHQISNNICNGISATITDTTLRDEILSYCYLPPLPPNNGWGPQPLVKKYEEEFHDRQHHMMSCPPVCPCPFRKWLQRPWANARCVYANTGSSCKKLHSSKNPHAYSSSLAPPPPKRRLSIAHAETAITTIRQQREFRRKEAHTLIANIDWHTSTEVKPGIPNLDQDFGSNTDKHH